MKELAETFDLFRHAFAGSLLVALTCSVLGVLVVGRRMVLVGVALPQVAAAGIGLSFLAEMAAWTAPGTALAFTRNHSLMATAACVGGLVFLVRRPGPRRLPAEVTTGVVFAVCGALAVLAVQASAQGMEELRHLVEGEILGIHGQDLPDLALILGGVLLLHGVPHRRLVFVSYDPEMAATLGVRVRWHELLFHGSLAVAVAQCVHAAGTLFVFAFLLLPAAAALAVARRVWAVFAVAAATGVLGAAAGFLLAADERVDWPVGPTSTLTVFVLFLLALGAGRLRDRLRVHHTPMP